MRRRARRSTQSLGVSVPSQAKSALRRVHRTLRLRPGDIYEDCAYHPVMCLGVNYRTDEIWGVSLVDGTFPRSCSLVHCGVRKLTPKQAWSLKRSGPSSANVRARIPADRQWWLRSDRSSDMPVRLVLPTSVRRLTPRSSGRVKDKVPSPKRRRRAAQLNRLAAKPNDKP
jgi:hypothetical protein